MNSFFYCFDITLKNGKVLYFTSSDTPFFLRNNTYLPYSGLQLLHAEFNDSAKNQIVLTGVFEPKGIERSFDLISSNVKVMICKNGLMESIACYICSSYKEEDVRFELYLEPQTVRYNQSLLKVFSKSCRTNFGDSKCMIDKALYSYNVSINQIIGTNIITNTLPYEDGYFVCGEAIFGNKQFIAKILNQKHNSVELDSKVPDELKNSLNVVLITGCDKKFTTCCNKFGNQLNFRGEPFIPEQDFLETLHI